MNKTFTKTVGFCSKGIFLAILAISTTIIFSSLLSFSVHADVYTTSLSTSGNVNLDVSIIGDHANVTSDNVEVVSTCPLGYDLSIAATSATNSSFSDTTLYKSGDSTSSSMINPTAGTVANPAKIVGDNLYGTWGYSLTTNANINSNYI